ncbi:MAG: choline/ethanolamine kinase family protein [Bauldia sp.]
MSEPSDPAPQDRAARLAIWTGPVTVAPLGGGITNRNFVVTHAGERYVVRIGDDIVVHHVMRFNERAASRAAHAAGISPELVHAEPGVLVMRYIDGMTCKAEDIRDDSRLARMVALLKRVHREMPRHLRGPLLAFWVFHVIRDYAHTLDEAGSRHRAKLAEFRNLADDLERAVGPVDLVFGHNDLLPGNLIDDGRRLWLIDWDYAGFNSPLFDLANLAANSGLDRDQEDWLLADYFDRPPTAGLYRSYLAMKCASLLREAMWSMTSEIYSALDFDYASYTADYLDRFGRALATFQHDRPGS